METHNVHLPPHWTFPQFTQTLIGEDHIQDLNYLNDVLYDLSLYNCTSWHHFIPIVASYFL